MLPAGPGRLREQDEERSLDERDRTEGVEFDPCLLQEPESEASQISRLCAVEGTRTPTLDLPPILELVCYLVLSEIRNSPRGPAHASSEAP